MKTVEVAQMLQVAPVTINNIKIRLNIPVEKDDQGNLNFSAENISAIKYYLNTNSMSQRMRRLFNKNKTFKDNKILTFEELEKMHPLVKDKRFLNLNCFPKWEEITPKCFQELEEK